MAIGICQTVFPCKKDGDYSDPNLPPASEEAVGIYFAVNSAVTVPPQDQLELKRDIERTLHALEKLYIDTKQPIKFRPYYVQLVKLAQLGLAGQNTSTEIARRALDSLIGELIDNEGARVKNGHLVHLACWSSAFSAPLLLIYCLLRLIIPSGSGIDHFLHSISIEPITLSCFILLWVGCFLGVVLSYGARSTNLTLNDLITVDADRLRPGVRLIFAGALTAVFGIFLVLGIVEVKIGSVSSGDLSSNSMVAFLIGTLCGMSELALPGVVAKKATDLLSMK